MGSKLSWLRLSTSTPGSWFLRLRFQTSTLAVHFLESDSRLRLRGFSFSTPTPDSDSEVLVFFSTSTLDFNVGVPVLSNPTTDSDLEVLFFMTLTLDSVSFQTGIEYGTKANPWNHRWFFYYLLSFRNYTDFYSFPGFNLNVNFEKFVELLRIVICVKINIQEVFLTMKKLIFCFLLLGTANTQRYSPAHSVDIFTY